MTLYIIKTRAITFSRKTNIVFLKYKLWYSYINLNDRIENLGVLIY